MIQEHLNRGAAHFSAQPQILIKDCTLLDPEVPGHLRHHQDILLSGQTIQAIGPSNTLDINPFRIEHTIDGKERLALPGMINAHTHSLENMLKATSPSLPLELWLIPLFSENIQWNPRFVYLSALLGAIEMLKSGTTAVLDHLWTADGVSLPSLNATMEAYHTAGIRAAVAPSIEDQDLVLEAGQAHGLHFPHHPFIDRFHTWAPIPEQLAALDDFIAIWHNSAEGRLRCLIGPSGIHWCSAELLASCNAMAQRYQTGLHLHAVETEIQAKVIRDRLGMGGIKYLRQQEVLRPGTSLAHAIWLDDGDLELLAESGSSIVHNPISNLRLGSGRFHLVQALEKGVTVALGSDGSASNDTQNMFGVLKFSGLLHNQPGEDYRKWPQPHELLEATTRGGATALGMEDQLGKLAPGYLADIILLNLENSAFFPLRDPYLHLVYCENGSSVDTVIVNGRVVVEHGKVQTVDEQALRAEIRKHYASLWPDFPAQLTENTQEVLNTLETLRQVLLQPDPVSR
ncbi:MAG TPA: amidohydrolase family protein [Ktedonobacteraceae bacterium]|nr:amidohydrolase family protein [Ktedonobacteraceae bacterium]